MGVESDQLVFDYLSRVGDLAQTALPAAQRRQLVAQLRTDIERRRSAGDSPAAVRRILGRIGTPDEVVEAAAGAASGPESAGTGGFPPGADPGSGPAPGSGARRDGRLDREAGPQVPRDPAAASAPGPDWWSLPPRGVRPRAGDELAGLPGMTGGVFFTFDDDEAEGPAGAAKGAQGAGDAVAPDEDAAEAAPSAPRRRLPLPRLARGRSGRTAAGARWGSPVLLLAAALLLGGAALGSWIPLGLGWLAAYLSRRLTRPQAKFAVLGIPGAAAGAMLVWLWGRGAGKWGTPIAPGGLGQAMQDAFPVTVRLAALGSALYLLWRSRRAAGRG